jgi:glutamate synthase domain-containing protein 1
MPHNTNIHNMVLYMYSFVSMSCGWIYSTDLTTSVSSESVELLLQYYLQMDGRGSVHFKPIESDTEEFGS